MNLKRVRTKDPEHGNSSDIEDSKEGSSLTRFLHANGQLRPHRGSGTRKVNTISFCAFNNVQVGYVLFSGRLLPGLPFPQHIGTMYELSGREAGEGGGEEQYWLDSLKVSG